MQTGSVLTVYLISAALLLFLSSQTKRAAWQKAIIFAVIVGTILTPVFIDSTVRNFAQAIVLLILMALERLWAAKKHSFFSSEHLKGAAFISLKRIVSLGIILTLVHKVLDWPTVPWALKTHFPVWIQALVALIVMDFIQYAWHWMRHKNDFLWKFHKLHHATEELTVLASGRDNLIEWVPRQVALQSFIYYTLGISFDAYLFGYMFPAMIIDGLNHADIDFPGKRFMWLSKIISSPNAHAVHHAVDGANTNFGFLFMFWDVLFGTFTPPLARPVTFGLESRELDGMGIIEQHVYSLRELMPSPIRANTGDAE